MAGKSQKETFSLCSARSSDEKVSTSRQHNYWEKKNDIVVMIQKYPLHTAKIHT